jgi:DNA modification methylase
LALNAGWDEELLSSELTALRAEAFNLELVGFDAEVVESLLAEQGSTEELQDPDAVPAVPAKPVSLPNDLWVLGDHRLLCGDATRMEALDTVLGGGRPDMIFTDPPYGVRYQGKTPQRLTIDNDALGEGFYDFLHAACRNMFVVCQGALYICMSCAELHTLHQAFTNAGGHWSTFLIWAKHHFTLGRSDYQRQYEVILYGWPNHVDHYWCGARDQGDVWFIVRPVANREHPTMKPIELVERAIHNSSRIGDMVLDPFAGSGTTLIACQRQQRKARLIEIDPHYADVICRRWEEFTGESALLDGDGRTFREIQQERHCEEAA